MAKMIKCNSCKKDVANTADRCPHCGASTPAGTTVAAIKAVAFFGIILTVVWLVSY